MSAFGGLDESVEMCRNQAPCAASNGQVEHGRAIMRRYSVVGLGLLVGLSGVWGGENTGTAPATQPAASLPSPGGSGGPRAWEGKTEWLREVTNPHDRNALLDELWGIATGQASPGERLLHAPPIEWKNTRTLKGWFEHVARQKVNVSSEDDNWLIFRSGQLNDNDRVWIHAIQRQGDKFTMAVHRAKWTGQYAGRGAYLASPLNSHYTYYAANLGRLPAGRYSARLVVQPYVFAEFDAQSVPHRQSSLKYPQDARPDDQAKPTEMEIAWTVAPPENPPPPAPGELPVEGLLKWLGRFMPGDWELTDNRHGQVEPTNWQAGPGRHIRFQRKGYKPVDWKFGKGGEISIWVMDEGYAPKMDKGFAAQVMPAQELPNWYGRRAFLWGAADDWAGWDDDVRFSLKATERARPGPQAATRPASAESQPDASGPARRRS